MFGDKFNLGNIGSLMKNAKKIQDMMQEAQEEMAKLEVTGEAGGGMAKVVMNGEFHVKEIIIEASLEQEDASVRNDLIAAAFNDAIHKVKAASQESMGGASELLNGLMGDKKNQE